ncbi:ABC transporter ATP-binding protein [Segnochrobactrum spirostomi]|uniref:ABC transporter ATP-binding protein n=1 Tax=Segnochrobactrum spirostomi TaxID=2608987 RepID=UPI0028A7D4ED|nr:ABC transporter ATP-binding protein [Segnochrobactrum spirostomi]
MDNVSLDIARGEFLTLLGPSGSGKTTLLMMLAGFVMPTSGHIEVDDQDVTHLPPERRNFGMVFQGYALFPHMTVADNIAYPLKVRSVAKDEIARRVAWAMSLVRLGGFGERYPRQLSGGQQQRVAIARALVFDPLVVLFDEPLGALDRKLRAEVQAEFKTLHQELGTTFVYVTHDQEEALSMSDRIAIVDGGHIIQAGRPDELYERPRTRFVANFLGTSNCFAGKVAGRDGEAIVIDVAGARIRHRGAAAEDCAAGRDVAFALRPEKLKLAPAAREDLNSVRGTIADVTYLGANLHVSVETEALGRLAVTMPAWSEGGTPVAGAETWVSWPSNATVVLADEVAA